MLVLLPKIKKIPKNTNGRLAIPAPAGLLVLTSPYILLKPVPLDLSCFRLQFKLLLDLSRIYLSNGCRQTEKKYNTANHLNFPFDLRYISTYETVGRNPPETVGQDPTPSTPSHLLPWRS